MRASDQCTLAWTVRTTAAFPFHLLPHHPSLSLSSCRNVQTIYKREQIFSTSSTDGKEEYSRGGLVIVEARFLNSPHSSIEHASLGDSTSTLLYASSVRAQQVLYRRCHEKRVASYHRLPFNGVKVYRTIRPLSRPKQNPSCNDGPTRYLVL